MYTTVTSNGQITIDASLRKSLKINPGDKVLLKREGNTIVVTKKDPAIWFNPLGIFSDDIYKELKKDQSKRYKKLMS